MTKHIYLGLSILDISRTLMYKFWYNYSKPKYGDRAKLHYMDTDSFVIYIKTEDFYKDIANNVERWFYTSSCNEKDERSLLKGKNKKVIGLFKDELGRKIMIEFVALRAKAYVYLLNGYDNNDYDKNKIINKAKPKEQRSVL